MSIDKDKKDIMDYFDDDFEVTYNADLLEKQVDVKDDAYKDVLSALSELDNTHSFDYLEANKTRTINLEVYLENTDVSDEKDDSALHNPLEKAIMSCKKIIHTFTPGKK